MTERHDAYDWNDGQIVSAVARGGSLSAAASELGFNQATVSRRLAALEDRAGGPLFERGKRGAVPTPRGSALIAAASGVSAAIDSFWRTAQALRATPREVVIKANEGVIVYLLDPFVSDIPFGPMWRARQAMDVPPLDHVRLIESGASAEECIGLVWAPSGERPSLPTGAVAQLAATVPMTLAISHAYAERLGGVPQGMDDLHTTHLIINPLQREGALGSAFAQWIGVVDRAAAAGARVSVIKMASGQPRKMEGGDGISAMACYATLQLPTMLAFDVGLVPMEPDLWIYMTEQAAGLVEVRKVYDLLVEGFRRALLRPCADCQPGDVARPCRGAPRPGRDMNGEFP